MLEDDNWCSAVLATLFFLDEWSRLARVCRLKGERDALEKWLSRRDTL